LTERSIDKKGQQLLTPQIELEGWWTSLTVSEEDVIQLYADHGTSEQFHSEFKTDLDIERLPSGKFATNALVLGASMLAYNILRYIGQNGLLGPGSPKRNKAKSVISQAKVVEKGVFQPNTHRKSPETLRQ
jgi:hypothetical protein